MGVATATESRNTSRCGSTSAGNPRSASYSECSWTPAQPTRRPARTDCGRLGVRDVEVNHPVDVLRLGWPREGGDRVAEGDASVEAGPEVGGLGECVCMAGEASGDDGEEVVEGVNAFVFADGAAADGDGNALADRGHEHD